MFYDFLIRTFRNIIPMDGPFEPSQLLTNCYLLTAN